jgi:hypothetical protein
MTIVMMMKYRKNRMKKEEIPFCKPKYKRSPLDYFHTSAFGFYIDFDAIVPTSGIYPPFFGLHSKTSPTSIGFHA